MSFKFITPQKNVLLTTHPNSKKTKQHRHVCYIRLWNREKISSLLCLRLGGACRLKELKLRPLELIEFSNKNLGLFYFILCAVTPTNSSLAFATPSKETRHSCVRELVPYWLHYHLVPGDFPSVASLETCPFDPLVEGVGGPGGEAGQVQLEARARPLVGGHQTGRHWWMSGD